MTGLAQVESPWYNSGIHWATHSFRKCIEAVCVWSYMSLHTCGSGSNWNTWIQGFWMAEWIIIMILTTKSNSVDQECSIFYDNQNNDKDINANMLLVPLCYNTFAVVLFSLLPPSAPLLGVTDSSELISMFIFLRQILKAWTDVHVSSRTMLHASCTHITPVLKTLHWLIIPARIDFKILAVH